MANNDDDSRRNRERPEDNPFIAFRRFADSQVSSLLNTVFTLPATIANYNNVHQAREACLFKKAGKAQCDKLQELEEEIASLRNEGRELYRVGDLQQVLKKSEELMQLDRHADELRKDIVAESGIKEEDSKELVQRVANKKGQEWGWDWSWGFPKPFDDDRDSSQPASADRHREQAMAFFKQIEREAKNMFGDEQWDDAIEGALGAMGSSPMLRALMGDKEWQEIKNFMNETRPYSPQALEADRRMQLAGVNWREAYEDLVRAQEQEDLGRRRESRHDIPKWSRSPYPKRVPWTDEEADEPSYEYAHDHEDQHDDPPTPKTKQEGAFRDWCDPAENQKSSDKNDIMAYLREQQQNGRGLTLRQQTEAESSDWCAPAESQNSSDKDDIMAYLREQHQQNGRSLGHREQAEDNDWCGPAEGQSASDKRDIQKFLSEQEQQNGRYLGLREPEYIAGEWCDPAASQSASDKRDIQKFLSEQQQQNGRQLGLRDSSETELDAYEQLLEKPKSTASSEARPSILSTLTTTERTVAPNGSVTTKIVLKKRFADGREESTETVHTQRGQESDPWETVQQHVAPKHDEHEAEQRKEKKSGWFWSS
jgi:hypothetical protein